MYRYYEAIVLILLSLTGLTQAEDFFVPVIVFVVTLSLIIVTQLFERTILASILIVAMAVTCGIIPVVFCMFPLIVYVAMCEKRWYLAAPALMVFNTIGQTRTGFRAPLTWTQYLIASVGALIAILLYLRLTKLEEANQKLRDLRDEVAGANETLHAQNDRLTEAQDNEIRLATLKERNRIAREIHDNVGHMLTRSLLQTGALLTAVQDEEQKEMLAGLRDTLDQAMTSIRESVHDLHDDSVDLHAVIEESARSARDRFEVTVEYHFPADLAPSIRLGMAGIVREAVSNAIRHSNGDTLKIITEVKPTFYRLLIRDNGRNFDLSTVRHHGIGLSTMEERAREMKGSLLIDSGEDGFSVTVSVPR